MKFLKVFFSSFFNVFSALFSVLTTIVLFYNIDEMTFWGLTGTLLFVDGIFFLLLIMNYRNYKKYGTYL